MDLRVISTTSERVTALRFSKSYNIFPERYSCKETQSHRTSSYNRNNNKNHSEIPTFINYPVWSMAGLPHATPNLISTHSVSHLLINVMTTVIS